MEVKPCKVRALNILANKLKEKNFKNLKKKINGLLLFLSI